MKQKFPKFSKCRIFVFLWEFLKFKFSVTEWMDSYSLQFLFTFTAINRTSFFWLMNKKISAKKNNHPIPFNSIIFQFLNTCLWASGISGSNWRVEELRVDKFLPPLNSPMRTPLTARTGLSTGLNSSACEPQRVRVTLDPEINKIVGRRTKTNDFRKIIQFV